mgnify:CR=1 FL=1
MTLHAIVINDRVFTHDDGEELRLPLQYPYTMRKSNECDTRVTHLIKSLLSGKILCYRHSRYGDIYAGICYYAGLMQAYTVEMDSGQAVTINFGSCSLRTNVASPEDTCFEIDADELPNQALRFILLNVDALPGVVC